MSLDMYYMPLTEYKELSLNYTYCNLEVACSKFFSKSRCVRTSFQTTPPVDWFSTSCRQLLNQLILRLYFKWSLTGGSTVSSNNLFDYGFQMKVKRCLFNNKLMLSWPRKAIYAKCHVSIMSKDREMTKE